MALTAPAILDRVLAQARLRRAVEPPRQIHLQVTGRCFLPCTHCDIYKNEAEDLPEATWARVIDELSVWVGPASMNFVGGEPLMRTDLERLMLRATERGFTVTFNTNAWLLNDKRARALCDAGVSVAYLSLDGFHEATVDRSRGRSGTWKKVMEAVDRLGALPNPRVIITTILHGGNAAEIPLLLAWCQSRGLELVVQPLYQNFGENAHDPGWWRRAPMWPTDLGAIDAALDVLVDERRRAGKVCNPVEQLEAFRAYFRDPSVENGQVCKAGHSDLAFDPGGTVRLCYFLEPVGNIHDAKPIRDVWNSAVTMRRRYEVHTCTRSCNLLNCNFGGAE